MKNYKNEYIKIFIGVTLLAFVIFTIITFRTQGRSLLWLVMQENYNWQFSDYFRQIVYASDLKNIYFNTSDAPFPPFAYIFFHVLYLLNPIDFDNISLECWKQAQGNNNLLIFFFNFMIVCLLLYWIIEECLGGGKNIYVAIKDCCLYQ